MVVPPLLLGSRRTQHTRQEECYVVQYHEKGTLQDAEYLGKVSDTMSRVWPSSPFQSLEMGANGLCSAQQGFICGNTSTFNILFGCFQALRPNSLETNASEQSSRCAVSEAEGLRALHVRPLLLRYIIAGAESCSGSLSPNSSFIQGSRRHHDQDSVPLTTIAHQMRILMARQCRTSTLKRAPEFLESALQATEFFIHTAVE